MHHFLSFIINRFRFLFKTFGSLNAYLIFQVIAWRHILIIIEAIDIQVGGKAVELWFKLTETDFKKVFI